MGGTELKSGYACGDINTWAKELQGGKNMDAKTWRSKSRGMLGAENVELVP